MIVSNYLYEKLESPPKNNNELTYYCAMDAFCKIVQKKNIYMSDLTTMNDPAEMIVQNFNISNVLCRLYENDSFKFDLLGTNFYDYVADIDNEITKAQFKNFAKNYFAICLSSESDSLNMWRMYGDDGRGIGLTFNREDLIKYVKKDAKKHFEDIIYLDNTNQIVQAISTEIFSKIKKLALANDVKALKTLKSTFLTDINNLSFKYKTKDYEDEREARIVDVQNGNMGIDDCNIKSIKMEQYNGVNVRLRNNQLVMYKDFNLENLLPVSIVLGPNNNQDIEALKIFLAKNQFYVKNIYKSYIPYRNVR